MALIAATLRQAAGSGECLLCAARREAEQQYLWFWVREGTNDGAAIGKLLESRGFCPPHAALAVALHKREWGDGLGIATTYEYLLARLTEELNELSFPAREPRTKAGRRERQQLVHTKLGAQALCPVCARADNATRFAARCLLEELEDSGRRTDWRSVYKRSAGLCLPHLRLALEIPGHAAATEFLLTTEREHVAALLGEVREYIRKCDYRFKQEPRGGEQTSWVRAVTKFAGTLPTDLLVSGTASETAEGKRTP